MKTLYEQLLPKIVEEFSLQSPHNIEILNQMNSGFSGAEVYEVELKAPAKYSGKYFLKIDKKEEEFCNHEVAKGFSHAVKYIEAKKIDAFHILLIELAGNSSMDYKSFFESPSSICEKQISNIVQDCLKESIVLSSFAPQSASLSKICAKMLGDKITPGGTVETFLTSRLAEPVKCSILFQDKLYPNPLYFSRNNISLQNFYYLNAKIHGDFHGENIFLEQDGKNYVIIDWALAREDGILFFDDAYFELSMLMQIFEDVSLNEWVKTIEDVCLRNWDKLDFEKAGVIKKLYISEDAWIKSTNSISFSHFDKMKVGQYISRVIAGLNFAGKKRVSNRQREYAFIFSCIFLKAMFEKVGYQDWEDLPCLRWNQASTKNAVNGKDAMPVANYCAHFSEQFQYILICGSILPQDELTNEYLARIPWRGVLSLSTQVDEPLGKKINEVKYLRHLTIESDVEETIQNSDVWWAYASGHTSAPDSLTDSFPQWRNRYRNYLQNAAEKICDIAPPQELMLIVACDSLADEDEKKKVQKLLEYFDIDESENTHIAVLGAKEQLQIDMTSLANLNPVFFDVDMQALADYASTYMRGKRKAGIWLPQLDKKMGIQLEADDEKYITSCLEVMGDHLLIPSTKNDEVKAFYWGEPISWNAIDRQLPVYRHEMTTITKEIKEKIEKEQWGRFELSHAPGSGASVLVKEVCWNLRKDYPVVRVKQISSNLIESLKRIAKLTSLPMVILLDGDYSRNDAETIEASLRADLVSRKYILLYTYRTYSVKDSPQLGILNIREAEEFESHYVDVMSQESTYSPEEIAQRKGELQQLTQTQALAEFRLPFFYGMYTFQEDFVSATQYIEQIINKMKLDPSYCKIVSYLSIITYFSTSCGLSHRIVKKLLGTQKISLREACDILNKGSRAFVYVRDAEYRICHPVIAHKILMDMYGNGESLSTSAFCNICNAFIQDIRRLDGGISPSDYADQLVTSIFIKRSQIDRADDSQDTARNTFATIILLLDNPNLQEEVLQCLVSQFPQNPHCFQHYGRLLSSHSPSEVDKAKQQFDKAIQLDGHNPIHYHARGIMYMRYCRNLLKSNKFMTPENVYGECKNPVDRAIEDFETAVEMALNSNRENFQFNLAYPYSSILDICIMIVSNIKSAYNNTHYDIPFWESDSEAVRWCRSILAIAKRYNMNAEQEHPEIEENSHYKQAKKALGGIQLSQAELKTRIDANQEDTDLKILFLSNLDTHGDSLSSMRENDLNVALNYCETVIQSTGADGGLLWKWFQIYTHMATFSETHALGFLESLPMRDSNVTVNHLLQILYFCRFYRTQDPQDAEMALRYQRNCRALSYDIIGGMQRRSCRFFLSDTKALPLTDNRGKGIKLECTLTEDVIKEQSAHMTLNMDPRFKVVFVPYHNKELKIGQGVGTVVKATIGFSYNGLYGFDLELK